MKTVDAKIPDRLNRGIEALVERGWFASRDEVVREAKFVREDVEWGLRGRR